MSLPLNTIVQADVLTYLRGLPAGCVQCCVTSPPYWGLRSYGTEPTVWGGDEGCEHEWGNSVHKAGITGGSGNPYAEKLRIKGSENYQAVPGSSSAFCTECNAWRGHLGLEPTIDLFVEHTVMWAREVKRVLRDDGTFWLNMGDCFATAAAGTRKMQPVDWTEGDKVKKRGMTRAGPVAGLKPKDLVMMPHRVALALQADGWWVRMDIVWAKPNPMPESCTDRPTKAHEYIFLFTKSQRYFYDADAVREKQTGGAHARSKAGEVSGCSPGKAEGGGWATFQNRYLDVPGGRNLRSVLTFPTQPYPGAHFATFPQRLPETCIKAGTSHKACPECGAPWERVVEKGAEKLRQSRAPERDAISSAHGDDGRAGDRKRGNSTTLDFRPTCKHENDGLAKCIVLDPFAGSGTTGVVAIGLGRDFLGCDLAGGDKDLGKGPDGVTSHTANERLGAAVKGLSLSEHQQGQETLPFK